MKFTILILTSLVATSVFAGLPDGSYSGRGLWKSAKDQGAYQLTTTINGSAITATYTLSDGSQKEWKFATEPTTNGFFTVKAYGVEIGKGYCLDKVDLCHYEITVAKMVLEETLVAEDNKLYRFGSKDEGSGRIVWQEALDKN